MVERLEPRNQAESIYSLIGYKNPQNIEKLTQFLRSGDEDIPLLAANALDQNGWEPKTLSDLTFYFIAKGHWDKVVRLGNDAIPALLTSARSQDFQIKDMSKKVFDVLGCQPENLSPYNQAAYYLLTGELSRFEELLNDNDAVLSVAWDFLKNVDLSTRIKICNALKKKDTANTLQVLLWFKRDEDETVRNIANEASLRLSENSISLQEVDGALGSIKVPIARTILSVHPEFKNKFISKDDVDRLTRPILYLPPVGGKILAEGASQTPNPLVPSISAEEQIKIITDMRQRNELGEYYLHQLTVQGRLPDEFKYVALALILSSPYFNDWSKPFFEAEWGAVAPLVHDGGNVHTNLNPFWKNVKGRTDFLQRLVVVHGSNNILTEARAEQEEQHRQILEGKAYQRLALALHAKTGTAPEIIPIDTRNNLSTLWQNFRYKMHLLLGEYCIEGAADVTWFNDTPRKLNNWMHLRHEAEWDPIQKELVHLEQTRVKYPQLQQQIRNLLKESTDIADREIGILPKK